ncbi:hypothetical protein KCU78_g7410, partial [Aureobasidium melanogenum]
MILSTKAVGIKTYRVGNGNDVSAVMDVTYGKIKTLSLDLVIQIRSCYGEDESYRKIKGNNANLKESKQTSIDIGDDDDPAAVTAMLRFFYDAIYCVDGLDGKSTDQHLIMYRLADLYDAPELRREASRRLIERFSTSLRGWYVSDQDQPVTVNHIVRSISQILGPSADTFADNDIQGLVFNFVIQNASSLYKNELFQELLGDGTLFDEAFGRRFAQKTSELITRLESRIPKPNASIPAPFRMMSWGTPVADPSSWDSTGPTAW